MIIDISKSGYQPGYLPKTGIGVFHPFFATANAAVRKEALLKAGGFDPRCYTGEDVDMSIRVAREGYELWFEPTARITHFHRYTLKSLLKQWYQYGLGHAYLFRKHSPRKRLQFYRYDLSPNNRNPFGISLGLSIPFPLHGMIFLSSFHSMHLGLWIAASAWLLASPVVAAAALALSALSAAWYFTIRFDPATPVKSIRLSAIRYAADSAYVLGGFIGGIREKVLYLEATRTRKRS